MKAFFNTIVGRFVLLAGIVLLATADTLWGILGVLVLVSFREDMMEGMENMDGKYKNGEKANSDQTPDGTQQQNNDNGAADPKASGRAKDVKPEDWRKENCKADQVMLDGSVVSMDDFAAKFPNVSFMSGKCNPCMADCQIKVTAAAARLDAEEKVRSKNSNSMPASKGGK